MPGSFHFTKTTHPLQKCVRSVSINAVRKTLSILLLVLFGLPFVSPLFAMTAASESNLPACCRRGGKHECMMASMERMNSASQPPEFRTPMEKCPYHPASLASSHVDLSLSLPARGSFTSLQSHSTVLAQMESLRRISRDRSRQKRGPPEHLLS